MAPANEKKDKKEKGPSKMSLSTRATLRALIPLILLGALFAAGAVFLDRFYVKKLTDEKADMAVDILMAAATDNIITEDEDVLAVLATQAMEREPRIKRMVIVDEGGRVLLERSEKERPKDLITRTRELSVGGEVFGGLTVEIDFSEIPGDLKKHDMIFGGSVALIFVIILMLVKLFAKKYLEVPLQKISQRFRSVLGESEGSEAPALSGLYELSLIEPYMLKAKDQRTRLIELEEKFQQLMAGSLPSSGEPAVSPEPSSPPAQEQETVPSLPLSQEQEPAEQKPEQSVEPQPVPAPVEASNEPPVETPPASPADQPASDETKPE